MMAFLNKSLCRDFTSRPDSLMTFIPASNFSDTLNDHRPIVIDLWAEWCKPCIQLFPLYDKLAQKFNSKLLFTKLNIEEEKKIIQFIGKRKLFGILGLIGVKSLPTFLIVKHGEVAERWVGLDAGRLHQKIRALFDEASLDQPK